MSAPIIGIPYGLTKNPIISASIPMVTSFCKKDAIAPNIQNIISKYSSAVPIAYSSLPKSFFESPHTISIQTFTSI